jgi:isocitrate dehydrogenase
MIAGQNIANPSGLIQGTIQMLAHIGQSKVGEKIQNAWLKTIEDGIHTADIYKAGVSKLKVSTREFSDAVIERLGQVPSQLKAVEFGESGALQLPKYQRKPARNKELLGVDLFVHWAGTDANQIGKIMEGVNMNNIELNMITNRGIKVYPDGFSETFCTDHWRCRFKKAEGTAMNHADIIALLQKAADNSIDVVKTENLYAFDGKPAFSLGQGQ